MGNIALRLTAAVSLTLFGCACSGSEQNRIDDNWIFATSAAVLGQSPADLEKRLGKPTFVEDSSGPGTGGLAYRIGECKVEYSYKDNRIWLAKVKLDQSCKPSLKDVGALKGEALSARMQFANLPAGFSGSWRGTCIDTICGTYPATVWFYNSAGRDRKAPEILLEAHLDEASEISARDAWSSSLIGQARIYSAALSQMTICGTADQKRATQILQAVKIDAVSFGYGLDPAPATGCPTPNPSIEIVTGDDGIAPKPSPSAFAMSANDTGQVDRALKAQIVGAWVPEGESCESDAGIHFLADGKWTTLTENGSWSLLGSNFSMTTLERGEGEENIPVKVAKPEAHRGIISIAGHTMTQSFPGDTIILERCP
jgi:hypothetical protein